MTNLFALARAGATLTPGQRAFLKLVEGFVIAGAVTAVPVVADLLTRPGGVDWQTVIKAGAEAFTVAALMAASKYYKAQGEAPVANVLDTLVTDAAALGAAGATGKPGPAASAAAPVPMPAPSDGGSAVLTH